MSRSDFRSPTLSQKRLNSVPRRVGHIGPSHIEPMRFKPLDFWVAPMVLDPGLDVALAYIHHSWIRASMPDDVNAVTVVEVCVLKVHIVELAPNFASTFRPLQVHLNTSM